MIFHINTIFNNANGSYFLINVAFFPLPFRVNAFLTPLCLAQCGEAARRRGVMELKCAASNRRIIEGLSGEALMRANRWKTLRPATFLRSPDEIEFHRSDRFPYHRRDALLLLLSAPRCETLNAIFKWSAPDSHSEKEYLIFWYSNFMRWISHYITFLNFCVSLNLKQL